MQNNTTALQEDVSELKSSIQFTEDVVERKVKNVKEHFEELKLKGTAVEDKLSTGRQK